MALNILRRAISDMVAHARSDAPIEACGYLAGANGEATETIRLRNVDASAEHYTLDPKEQFDAVREARSKGLSVMGVYHSHPHSPARPSAEDIRLAFDPALRYVIVSLQSGEPVVKAFLIQKGDVREESIAVIHPGGGL